jgi:AcrR family transcriptional regulator
MERSESDGRPSEARSRLLSTAARVFYAEGIRTVGIDRIVAEAQVTRATLYRHFPGKEDLVLAYLGQIDQATRDRVHDAGVGGLPAADTLRAISVSIADDIQSPTFRGCAFLNAVAEYPDPRHLVHRAALAHRQWFLDTLTELLAGVRGPAAPTAARHFVMLRDGAMTAGCLFDSALVGDGFLRGVNGLISDIGM